MLVLMHVIHQKRFFLPIGTKAHFETLEFSPRQKPHFPQALIHGETVLVWGTAAVIYSQERIRRRMLSKCTGNIKWELLLTAKDWGLYYLL